MARITRINGQAQPNIYRATLYQEGTDAPIATVGENSLPANVTWVRNSAGLYYLTADSPIFIEGKVYVIFPYVFATVSYGRSSDTQVYLQENNTIDDWLIFQTIQVIVYP